jgi:hypothetical protein
MLNSLRVQCMRERELKAQQIGAAQSFFFGVDEVKLARANAIQTPYCNRLVEWERVDKEKSPKKYRRKPRI